MNSGLSGLIRNKLECWGRGRTLWRNLPEEFGNTPILISPDARLQHLKLGSAAFDNDLLQLAINHVKEDFIVWDIGANVGVFSFAAASLAKSGRVFAVEPDPWLSQLLVKSIQNKRNSNLHIELVSLAIANSPGIVKLAIAERGRASNYLQSFGGRSQTGGVRMTHLVPVLSLDLISEQIPSPTLVQIDVEGAEWSVLQGGRALIEKSRPIIAIEVSNTTESNVTRFLMSLGYVLKDLSTDIPWNRGSNSSDNILALPK